MDPISRFSTACSLVRDYVATILAEFDSCDLVDRAAAARFCADVTAQMPLLVVSAVAELKDASSEELDVLTHYLVDDADDTTGSATRLFVALGLLARSLIVPPVEVEAT